MDGHFFKPTTIPLTSLILIPFSSQSWGHSEHPDRVVSPRCPDLQLPPRPRHSPPAHGADRRRMPREAVGAPAAARLQPFAIRGECPHLQLPTL